MTPAQVKLLIEIGKALQRLPHGSSVPLVKAIVTCEQEFHFIQRRTTVEDASNGG